MPKASADAPKFEDSLERLEAIVERLETGELSLEDALAAFEEGVGLSRECSEALSKAEQRIRVLSEDGLASEPFAPDADDAADADDDADDADED